MVRLPHLSFTVFVAVCWADWLETWTILAKERWEGHLQETHIPAAEVRLKSDRAYEETMGVKQQVAESLAGNVLIAQPPTYTRSCSVSDS